MENLNKNEIDYSIARQRVNQLKKFYSGLLLFVIVLAFFGFRKYYKTGEFNPLDFTSWSAIFWIWGIILAVRAAKIFLFNYSWETKMMRKQLNK